MTLQRIIMEEGVLELLVIGITIFLIYMWKE